MKLKHVAILFSSLLLAASLYAQEGTTTATTPTTVTAPPESKPVKVRTNEVALSLSYANGGMAFGILYKRKLGKRTWYRCSLANISISSTSTNPSLSSYFPYTQSSGSFDVVNGVEFRFKLHKRVETYTGIDLAVNFEISRTRTSNPALPINAQSDTDWSIAGGLGFNSGIIVQVVPGFHIGLNLSPSLRYSYSPWDSYDAYGNLQDFGNRQGFSTSFSTSSVQLLFVYRWDRDLIRTKRAPRMARPMPAAPLPAR